MQRRQQADHSCAEVRDLEAARLSEEAAQACCGGAGDGGLVIRQRHVAVLLLQVQRALLGIHSQRS